MFNENTFANATRNGRAGPHGRQHGSTAPQSGSSLHRVRCPLRSEWRRSLRQDGLQRHRVRDYGRLCEGLGVLKAACAGKRQSEADAETTPLRDPEHYQYEFNLTDISEVWRRGSVIASWLLDLTATALAEDPNLSRFAGRVSDSGEGRWTIKAAIDVGVPVPVLTTALYERFASRGEADFQDKLLSAMRFGFGGHLEKPATGKL